ncbi:hypothetical protein [Lysobacter capsici]|uniref:hypothetical protein n=1 Tax=Lysobacter capsici TaxID=435897 RepID=UPI00287BABDB|nr:hypothetical protein [Lysobacter capsici]WND82618.1 hypothetical protein RJ610_09840 [Lysobacter capsici]WND87815.1 hypothetical protein RJ609_09845 [Lysobacter capsici]
MSNIVHFPGCDSAKAGDAKDGPAVEALVRVMSASYHFGLLIDCRGKPRPPHFDSRKTLAELLDAIWRDSPQGLELTTAAIDAALESRYGSSDLLTLSAGDLKDAIAWARTWVAAAKNFGDYCKQLDKDVLCEGFRQKPPRRNRSASRRAAEEN